MCRWTLAQCCMAELLATWLRFPFAGGVDFSEVGHSVCRGFPLMRYKPRSFTCRLIMHSTHHASPYGHNRAQPGAVASPASLAGGGQSFDFCRKEVPRHH
jgi:hypothetical protein